MKIFVNFNLDLHFQGHLLHGQAQCDHFGENLRKIGWIVSEIVNVFSGFSGDTFSTWKIFEKTDYMCFSLHLEKVEKEAKFLGKK